MTYPAETSGTPAMAPHPYRIAEVPVALLAGGLATRLRPDTEQVPKALLDMGGRPFIDFQMDLFRRHGIRRVVLCLGYLGEAVEAHLGRGTARDMEFLYSYDGDRLLGTGGALRRAAHLLVDVCWVCYGDSYMDIDYRAILDSFRREGALGLMTVVRNADRWDRSNAVFRDGRLLRYSKRVKDPAMTYIDFGAALLRREAIERIPPGVPYDLAQLYEAMAEEGTLAGYEVSRRFYEIGTPASLDETRAYLSGLKT